MYWYIVQIWALRDSLMTLATNTPTRGILGLTGFHSVMSHRGDLMSDARRMFECL